MTLEAIARRRTAISTSPPSTPRLRMEATGSRRTLLDGGWWPRSADPVEELPGLVLAIDKLHGPVTRLVLADSGWDIHPRRLGVAGRVLRLGYFASQPASLLTALCANDDRVDLLIVPPGTEQGLAEAAMVRAADADSRLHAPDILRVVGVSAGRERADASEEVWEGEGGQRGRA